MARVSPFWLALALGLIARGALLVLVPENYSFDAWQRWAGRDHLLVRDWLPGAQLLVCVFAQFGIGAVKAAFAAVGALGAGAAAALAERLAGRSAGLCVAALSVFGPALTWTVVPYQEGPFLALLLGGLALSLSPSPRRVLLADLLVGALPLVRTEGWPLVALYVLWRRAPSAARALWGAVLWGLVVAIWRPEGYAPSPVDYADWNGLIARFDLDRWLGDAARFGRHALLGGTIGLLPPAAWGLARGWRIRGVPLVALALLGQLAVTGLWIAGLEAATVRMQVSPGALLAVLAGVGLAQLPASRPARVGVALYVALFAAWGLQSGLDNAQSAARVARPELELAAQIEACGACTFAVTPRQGLGTRDRHDGCEILEGVTRLRAGQTFTCTSWPGERLAAESHAAVWVGDHYQITPLGPQD